MFLTNKYTECYYKIINKAKTLQRTKKTPVYYESHHIIPKCMGGSDRKFNRILLTPKEHYICHLLLLKMTTSTNKAKLYAAFCRMKSCKKYTSRSHALHRELFSNSIRGKNNPNFNNKWSNEKKQRLSNYFKSNRSYNGINNPAFGNSRPDLIERNKLPKAWVTNDIEDKLILRETLPTYISKGYRIGRTQQQYK